ncbi:TonB-dependent receptor [Qipengyuania sp. 1NDH17]|uniref:TonB-dependent receptor n=1 Tax=Qipengyuania polymorpha TaxID=2867234 RepID=A0ABS7ITU7_9SPHN|nr:TonB-dependent receptor [Qipengyuania polymorpha]MBX7456782.1 TonB-dependent receptor [Qipengyuania polymorpha]
MAAAACGIPQVAFAMDEQDDEKTIIITGTRADRSLDEEPYPVEVVTLEDLQRELPRTVPEALRSLPGVLVQKTASGHGSPYIRGFTGNRTLLVVDGIRYNNATYRDGANEYFAQVDQFTLAQIELVSGPASALYGSEAVGGTIVLTTRPSAMLEKDGDFFEGEQFLRWSSGDGSLTSRTGLGFGEGGTWGFRGGFTARDYNDIRAAELGRLPYTGFTEKAFDGRFDIALSPGWTATLAHQSLWQDDVPRTHSTVYAVPFEGTVVGDDLVREKDHRRSLTYAKLRGGTDSRWVDTLDLTLSFQRRSEIEDRTRNDGRSIEQGFDSAIWALSGVATADLGSVSMTYGLDASHETIDSEREDFNPATGEVRTRLQGPVGDDADYEQVGTFVRADFSLSEQVLIEAGMRFSHVATDIGTFAEPVTGEARSLSGSWSDLSGSFRGQYTAREHRVWAAYSRSFRAPNVADISRFGASRSSEIEVASLGLEPEKFDTFELAYRYETEMLELGASAHTTALIDYIETVPTGRMREGLVEVAKKNAASGRISGLELFGRAALAANFSLEGNLSWLRGRLTSPTADGPVREPISRIQPLTANLALAWERGEHWLRADMQWADKADELSSGDLLDRERIPPEGTPGYVLLGLRGGTQIAEGLELNLALENLLDEAWRPHGSGNNEPGRHVTAGLHLTF